MPKHIGRRDLSSMRQQLIPAAVVEPGTDVIGEEPHCLSSSARIRAQLAREGARWHCGSGEEGDAPSGPERIGTGDFVTMRLRAQRDSDQ
jgi:hypothetical protein